MTLTNPIVSNTQDVFLTPEFRPIHESPDPGPGRGDTTSDGLVLLHVEVLQHPSGGNKGSR